jgi:hypothetical protein
VNRSFLKRVGSTVCLSYPSILGDLEVCCRVGPGNTPPPGSVRYTRNLTGTATMAFILCRNPAGFAFVTFDDQRDADDAIAALDGKNGWKVCSPQNPPMASARYSAGQGLKPCGSLLHTVLVNGARSLALIPESGLDRLAKASFAPLLPDLDQASSASCPSMPGRLALHGRACRWRLPGHPVHAATLVVAAGMETATAAAAAAASVAAAVVATEGVRSVR